MAAKKRKTGHKKARKASSGKSMTVGGVKITVKKK
jgi:hypothetical protein